MRILLIGEYSGLHNTLKAGLTELGHEVLLVGTGDGFKKYPVDLDHDAKVFSSTFLHPLVKLVHKITGVNLIQSERARRFKKLIPQLSNFDIVQLINEQSIKVTPKKEIEFIKQLKTQNKSLFLLSCGTDYSSVKYAHDNKLRYSILTPFQSDETLKANYKFIIKYISKPFKQLHDFLFETIDGVIASDLDYHLPLVGNKKYLGLIPNPINSFELAYNAAKIDGKIIIFHGVNSTNYVKKGNRFFEEAIDLISQKYSEKIEIINTKDLPFKDYIKAYNTCHILLDQVYSYDQGYNALEAMAKGKVVFTGAEKEWLEYYNLEENSVAINALPDTRSIFKMLEWLILNPKKIIEISANARQFILDHHDYLTVSESYLEKWNIALDR
ncbi:MAG: glycosyltransferase [Bacteroidia bacterium]|nr:glycosyltransferase [Bacteroidia bacterium]NND25332.1 glycosyltransferase [Flavobacteriaceae bacterium]NNK59268.1 glycosyltransferase [Flavobacteriaceae bacterium]RZW44526.1 MAG: glycosyltransferase family 1 protein [Flavobacteriaceae bacterium]